jgi:hypothetical protein
MNNDDKEPGGTALAPLSDLQARLGESLAKYAQVRGFL